MYRLFTRVSAPLFITLAAAAVPALAACLFIPDPLLCRAAIIASICLALWLGETIPPYVPTLLLWALTPVLLQPLSKDFALARVLGWSADPVLALFFGGFVMGVAAARHRLDSRMAALAVQWSRGNCLALMVLAAGATAFLSMWLSNIAAAAMMLVALRPILAAFPGSSEFRRAVLLAVALGADFGGISTPIGTGPNAIAIAALNDTHPISFVQWMAFALPLAAGMLAAGLVVIALLHRVRGHTVLPPMPHTATTPGARWVLLVFAVTVAVWLSEPLHGIPSAVVALAVPVLLFGTGLLHERDLRRVDWSTLLLIAGGIALGNLLEKSGLVHAAAGALPWASLPAFVQVLVLCLASAILSALMSNTATVTMLIPIAASLNSAPSTAILVAMAASMGIPFVISTPPNAMVHGEGLPSRDLVVPGMLLMLAGCLLIAATGPWVLRLAGIP